MFQWKTLWLLKIWLVWKAIKIKIIGLYILVLPLSLFLLRMCLFFWTEMGYLALMEPKVQPWYYLQSIIIYKRKFMQYSQLTQLKKYMNKCTTYWVYLRFWLKKICTYICWNAFLNTVAVLHTFTQIVSIQPLLGDKGIRGKEIS